MHQQVPAVRRRRHLVDEQLVQAIILVPISQGEVERPLHLPAELLRLAFALPTRGQAVPPPLRRHVLLRRCVQSSPDIHATASTRQPSRGLKSGPVAFPAIHRSLPIAAKLRSDSGRFASA
jgi:hypothetical protein